MTDYNQVYDEFLALIDKGLADSTKASEALVRLSRIFGEYNSLANAAKKKAIIKLSELTQTVDAATNKPITGAKADALADASEENQAFMDLRTDLETLTVYISAVKYYSQGMVKEWSNASNT